MNAAIARKIWWHCIFPLFTGFYIYLATREGYNWIQDVFSFIHFSDRSLPWPLEVIKFNVSDFCWNYSFASSLFLWKSWTGSVTFSFFLLVTGLMLFAELIQIYIPEWFTFDWKDLVAAILAVGLSYFLNARNA